MFEQINITNKLLYNVVDITLFNYVIKTTPISKGYRNELILDSFVDNIYYLSTLFDLHISRFIAKKYALGRNIPDNSLKDKKIVNIRNVFEFIRSSASDKTLRLQNSLHINKLLTDGLVEMWDVARLRNPGEKVKENTLFGFKEQYLKVDDMYVVFHKGVNILYSEESKDLNILIKIALFTKYTIDTKLFAAYSDETILYIFHYLLLKNQFTQYISSIKVIYKVKGQLANAKDDIEWIEILLSSLRNEINGIYESVKSRSLLKDNKKRDRLLDLNSRQMKILEYISIYGRVSREIACKLNHSSTATTFRDLDGLCKKSYLKREGIGKGTKYIVSE